MLPSDGAVIYVRIIPGWIRAIVPSVWLAHWLAARLDRGCSLDIGAGYRRCIVVGIGAIANDGRICISPRPGVGIDATVESAVITVSVAPAAAVVAPTVPAPMTAG